MIKNICFSAGEYFKGNSHFYCDYVEQCLPLTNLESLSQHSYTEFNEWNQ